MHLEPACVILGAAGVISVALVTIGHAVQIRPDLACLARGFLRSTQWFVKGSSPC
jgi:hypothetical protein